MVEAAVMQCSKTLETTVDVSKEGIKKMIDTFKEKFRITQDQIEDFFGCRAEAINGPQMVRLRGIYASLRDGMSSPADWFKPKVEQIESKKLTLKEKLKAKEAAEEEPHEAKADEPAAPETSEGTTQD
ncbi:MAG: hypothetical protein MR009_01350 [Sutterellaceae bacterium]|nr:hypothetical protein [Sutterellaceae bacterium]MDY2869187.1 hypothetical protein [Mesosutterella sp.]